MRAFVAGIGLVGPGLPGWEASCAILLGSRPYLNAPAVLTQSDLLPAAERRRTGTPVKLALAAGSEALASSGFDPAGVATVFTSSSGDGETIHQLCETLAGAQREVSPTRFHNSVHNAAAGYWGIATRSREASTSICCHDASFAAGLLEAAARLTTEGGPLVLIAYDHPYVEPLRSRRPILGAFGVALVLSAEPAGRELPTLDIGFRAVLSEESRMQKPELEALRLGVPAARSLPLLAALAQASGPAGGRIPARRLAVELPFVAGSSVTIDAAIGP